MCGWMCVCVCVYVYVCGFVCVLCECCLLLSVLFTLLHIRYTAIDRCTRKFWIQRSYLLSNLFTPLPCGCEDKARRATHKKRIRGSRHLFERPLLLKLCQTL